LLPVRPMTAMPAVPDDDEDEKNMDASAGTDSDSDTDNDGGVGDDERVKVDLEGVVYAPEGSLPIAGALVYITSSMPDPIPEEAYCNECENMTGLKWTLTNPDGTFLLKEVLTGDRMIVVQKGQFRLVSDIKIGLQALQTVPSSMTTLPGETTADGRKTIPRIAVSADGTWDCIEDLLAKLGLGQTNANGKLILGSEHFDIYNHAAMYPGYPQETELLNNKDVIDTYHMIFIPCIGGAQQYKLLKDAAFVENIHDYVAKGGKWYGSCYAYDWVEQIFPEYIEFQGNDVAIGSAELGTDYDCAGTIYGDELIEWLNVVEPGASPMAFPLQGAWVVADSVAPSVDNGMGPDGGPIEPIVWATNNGAMGKPMTVTFPYGCGKVFFSAYHTVEEAAPIIRPQEKILTYLIMDIGVCSGDYIIE